MKVGKRLGRRISVLSSAAILALSYSNTSLAEIERYIVKFKPNKGQAVRAAAQTGGGRIELNLDKHDAFAVSIPVPAAKGLEKNPNVEYIEVDYKRYPLALSSGPQVEPYGISMVQASDIGGDLSVSSPIMVCIIDSGYSLGHPDLPTVNVSGQDGGGAGPWSTDGDGHGTHVAGTIAALDNNVGVVGVNDGDTNLYLHIVRVFGEDGAWAYSSSLVAAVDECQADAGSKGIDSLVVNMSLGGSFKSRTEDRAFSSFYASSNPRTLSIAAAGNDGNTRKSYPASYDSVVSVAAIDSDESLASFSQRNDQVELAAPGVSVLSTLPAGKGSFTNLMVGPSTYDALAMQGSEHGSAVGSLVDCGLGDSQCAGASGAICLIERGNISFADKVLNCEGGGGSGAVIFNNEAGPLSGTLGDVATTIPSVGISRDDGLALLSQLPSGPPSATVEVAADDYDYYDGTSMATPHVTGVAALVWSQLQTASCSTAEVRSALAASAKDLGASGRDASFGYGLVQTRAAIDHLGINCGGSGGGGSDDGGDSGGGGKPEKCHPKRGC